MQHLQFIDGHDQFDRLPTRPCLTRVHWLDRMEVMLQVHSSGDDMIA